MSQRQLRIIIQASPLAYKGAASDPRWAHHSLPLPGIWRRSSLDPKMTGWNAPTEMSYTERVSPRVPTAENPRAPVPTLPVTGPCLLPQKPFFLPNSLKVGLGKQRTLTNTEIGTRSGTQAQIPQKNVGFETGYWTKMRTRQGDSHMCSGPVCSVKTTSGCQRGPPETMGPPTSRPWRIT